MHTSVSVCVTDTLYSQVSPALQWFFNSIFTVKANRRMHEMGELGCFCFLCHQPVLPPLAAAFYSHQPSASFSTQLFYTWCCSLVTRSLKDRKGGSGKSVEVYTTPDMQVHFQYSLVLQATGSWARAWEWGYFQLPLVNILMCVY